MEFKPHDYQKYCIEKIRTDDALGLFLDMGLGKTVITLTAIKHLKYEEFKVNKVLVIAPKKVAESTWTNECAKWEHLKMLRVAKVLGTEKQRLAALNEKADIYIINRENVVWLVENCEWDFDMVVIDELSSFKSRQAKRWRALTWMKPKIKRIVGLTGTPAPNGFMDLWAQVYLLDGGERLFKRITQYREVYFEPDKRSYERVFTWKLKDFAEDRIKEKISDICISMKSEDYLNLPDMIIDNIPVALDSKAQAKYNEMEREALLQVDESIIDATTSAVLSNKLLQLCNGAVYDENGETVLIHDCKLEALKESVEALNGQHALLFYSFRHDIPRIKEALKGYNVRELKTPQDEIDWNAGKIDILLAHPASACYGLNLQNGGHHIIWFGLDWSLEKYLQANKRLHRQGQTEPVIIHHIVVQGGRDADVIKALEKKEKTQDELLESLKARIRNVQKTIGII